MYIWHRFISVSLIISITIVYIVMMIESKIVWMHYRFLLSDSNVYADIDLQIEMHFT